MTPEKLLNPRVKLIAHYPGSKAVYQIGHIIERPSLDDEHDGWGRVAQDSFDELLSCPANFQKLAWYEEREVSDMPEYIRTTSHLDDSISIVLKVTKWTWEGEKGWYIETEDNMDNDWQYWNDLPATLEEYTAFTQTQNK